MHNKVNSSKIRLVLIKNLNTDGALNILGTTLK